MTEVLRVTGLSVALPRGQKLVRVVDDLDLAIGAGEMLALVGQSGCGKTTAALSIPRLLPAGARVSGSIRLGGAELAGLAEPGLRALRGGAIGVVFQDPAAALNPSQRVGAQIAEAIRLHAGVRGHAGVGFRRRADIGAGLSADVGAGRRAAGDGAVERRAAGVQAAGRQAVWEQAVARLAEVGLAEPERRARDYPHQLSGGQRQRVSIAIALAGDPALLIADECTAGLDPVLARQVLDLIGGLRARRAMAVLLVTHDLAQVRRHADTVQVLYAGQAIERGPAGAVLARPLHPYSAMLRAAAPGLRPDRAGPWPMVRLFGGSGAPETDLAAEGSLVPERDVGGAPEPEVRGPSCRFAPRCAGVRPVCSTQPPPWSGQGESQARCFFAGEVTPAWGGPGAVAVASAAGEPVMGEVASAADEPGMGTVVRARGDPAAGGAARGRGEPAAGGVARARSGPEDEASLAATVSRGGQDRGPTPLGAGLAETGATAAGALLALERVSVSYRPRFGGSARLAVREVSLTIGWGECVGLVGASGSGKTSLGRAVLQMLPYEGAIVLGGTRLDGLAPGALRTARARMAVVFQDPAGSLDPAMRVDTLIAEPWRLAGIGRGERRARVPGLLARVGLAQSLAERRAGSLSGGQAQRVALARALAGQPDLLVLDEPTSSVDVWTQAGLLVLLRELLAAGRMGCLFITHDLAVARVLCHRIAVMEGGRLVEVQSAAGLVRAPVHAASRALVAAAS